MSRFDVSGVTPARRRLGRVTLAPFILPRGTHLRTMPLCYSVAAREDPGFAARSGQKRLFRACRAKCPVLGRARRRMKLDNLPPWVRVLLAVLLFSALLSPVWMVRFPPLLDYPNHLAGSFVLGHLNDSQFRFAELYRAEWAFYPYVAQDVSLLTLERIFPPEVAGRIFLSACLISLPLGFWIFLREANAGNDPLALWSLVLAYNVFFLNGFLNYCLSMGVCFLAVGLWLRYLSRPSPSRWLALLLVFTALYATHIFGFGAAALIVTAYGAFKRLPVRRLLVSWLLFLPGAFFYLKSQRGAGVSHTIEYRDLSDKLDWLRGFLQGYSERLDWLTLIALALSIGLSYWKNPEFRWNRAWAGVAAVLFAAYWALPTGYGDGWDIDVRVLPILLLAALAIARVGKRARWIGAVALLIFLTRASNVAHQFLGEQKHLEGLARSFEATPRNARVLPIVEHEDDDMFRRSYAHFWAYGVIRRGWLSPYLFALPGVQPLRGTDALYSPDGFWELEYKEAPDWEQVREDYDYVWAYNVSRFSEQLDAIGELVYADGALELYRVKKPEADSP